MIRLIGYFFGVATALGLLVAGAVAVYVGHLTKDLPDYEVLARYEPPVTTRIHASDGSLMAEYARERRLYLPIQAIPDRVKAAFLSAEDKNFYNHIGIDIQGIGRAALRYLTGGPTQGGSTITQQVAKNFLLTNERTIDRKIKEAILSFRIEQAYPKDRILELYLNEIYFDHCRGGLSCRLAQGAVELPSLQTCRSRNRTPQLGHQPDDREWLCDEGRRRQGDGRTARCDAAS
jgi:penicillin-binding protein 1A